jgi:hypothetical protein
MLFVLVTLLIISGCGSITIRIQVIVLSFGEMIAIATHKLILAYQIQILLGVIQLFQVKLTII